MSKIKTRNGNDLSLVGLGTFPFQGEEMASMIKKAYSNGYNLIDTADDYRGESGIGLAITRGWVERENIFIQTKISNDTAYADEPLAGVYFNPLSNFMTRHTVKEIVKEKVTTSLRKMNTDYLDSVLIHYPYPGYYEEIWNCLRELRDAGVIRYIGVSNCAVRHLECLNKQGEMPAINEVYISPLGIKKDLLDYSKANDILVMTYSALMDLTRGNLDMNIISSLSEKYHKTPSQIILRWNLDRGCCPLAKTKNENRMKENISIDDFQLTDEEVKTISSMNNDFQILTESKICPGL